MLPNLSFEQAPPISVPYRFFVTAPWFGVAAGLLLAWEGADMLASRWSPTTLAAVHLLTVGFMLQAMCGALLQFVPVAAGGNVWRPRLVADFVHPLLVFGAICLVGAFLGAGGALFVAASVLFGAGLTGYVAAVGLALYRTPGRNATLTALRLAVTGLAVAGGLGILLSVALGGGFVVPIFEVTQTHAAWGLGGWSLMLLIGVSYYVVPMFQLTPPYERRLAWLLPSAMAVLLVLWSAQAFAGTAEWQGMVFMAGMAIAAVYAGATLSLQARRRRKVSDPTLHFFRGAMLCLLVMAASGVWFEFDPRAGEQGRAAIWLGLLAIPGVFVSAISGMLYKILPFLNWLHLQQLGGPGSMPPNMREMIPERAMTAHMRLHFAAVFALLSSVLLPFLARPAGLLFAAACAWLGINLIRGVRAYVRFREAMQRRAPA